MRKWEIGVTEITPPHAPRWTGEHVYAPHEGQALEQAEKAGYYRNLVVRDVTVDNTPGAS